MDWEQERENLARDLHDSVCQPLAGICYHLQAAESHLAAGAAPAAGDLREARLALVQALAAGLKLLRRLDGSGPGMPKI